MEQRSSDAAMKGAQTKPEKKDCVSGTELIEPRDGCNRDG